MANGRILIFLLFLAIIAGCHSRYEYIELYNLPPRSEVENDYWNHILKQTSYDNTKISTMILIDDLLISDELTDKYHINIIYKQTAIDSTILLAFYHEGYDLLHINKVNESLIITADSIDYKLKAAKTNKDEDTFIYQCFQRSGITVQTERVYYDISFNVFNEILNSCRISIRLAGRNNFIETGLKLKTLNWLRKFNIEIINNQ